MAERLKRGTASHKIGYLIPIVPLSVGSRLSYHRQARRACSLLRSLVYIMVKMLISRNLKKGFAGLLKPSFFACLVVVTTLSIQHFATAQVCYIQAEEGGDIVDLSELCQSQDESTSSEIHSDIPGISNEELAEIILVETISDEVFEAWSPNCNTHEEYVIELTKFCNQTGRCPDSMVEQLRTGNL